MRPRPVSRCLAALLFLMPATTLAEGPAKDAATAATAAAKQPLKAAPAAAPKPVAQPVAKADAKPAAPAAKPKAGAGKNKKKAPQDAKVTGPVATYPGFRMLDGGASRVFVTLSKKVSVTEHKAAGKLTYRIQGMQVPTSTNRLPLLTSFFSTPVSRAELVNREGDVDLVIDVKDGVAAQFRVLETDKGAELQVDFPKPATQVEESAVAKPAEAPTTRSMTTKSLDSGPGAY